MLNINALKAGYSGQTIIDLHHFTATRGQKYLIRGASGCGKSTLLHTIAGFGPIQSGSITIDDIDIYKLPERQRDHVRGQKIGLVFQTLHLVKSLTVWQNILLGPFSSQSIQNTEWAQELLIRLGIADLASRAVTNISQGQAQRVAIARALVTKPALLLADEPTSSLDNQSSSAVIDMLQSLTRDTNTSLIVASHDDRITNAFDQVLELGRNI